MLTNRGPSERMREGSGWGDEQEKPTGLAVETVCLQTTAAAGAVVVLMRCGGEFGGENGK